MQKTQLIRGKYANDRAVRPWSASNPIEAAPPRADGEPTVLCPERRSSSVLRLSAREHPPHSRAPHRAPFKPGCSASGVLRARTPSIIPHCRRAGDQWPSPLRLSTAKVDRGSSRHSSSRCADRREYPGAGGMAKGFSREERDGICSITIQNRPPGIAQWSIAAFHRRFRKRRGERARLRKTNARGATSRAVKRKIKCSPIRPRGRVATAASMSEGSLRPPPGGSPRRPAAGDGA